MKQTILTIVSLLLCGVTHAGTIVASPGALASASCIVNADSTLTFTWCGRGKRVFVQGDFESADGHRKYDELHPRKIRMHLGSDSCYHLTTHQLVPELYTYNFVVDGKRVIDHSTPDTAWQAEKEYNIVTVPGSAQAAMYEQPAMSGQLIRTTWYDRYAERNRRVCVYLPAAYNQMVNGTWEDGKYPVLYLLHGISGYEGSWAERGRVIQIMENLIAEGKAEPMIVVMSDCNTDTCAGGSLHQSLWHSVTRYPRYMNDRSLEFAFVDLDHYIRTTYRVSGRRAIAGLSSGARIAASIAKSHPDLFDAVGLFSPVVYNEQLPEKQPEVRNQKSIVSYHIYVGKNDIFVSNARLFHRKLERRGIRHRYTETAGEHFWRNWRMFLVDFLTQL